MDSAALRCPRAAPALPPTHGLRLATRESLFAPVLYNVCYLRYASHLRRAALLTVHRRAAPLAHRSPPRCSRGLLAAAPPASALITECAARCCCGQPTTEPLLKSFVSCQLLTHRFVTISNDL